LVAVIEHNLPFRTEPYVLTLHFPSVHTFALTTPACSLTAITASTMSGQAELSGVSQPPASEGIDGESLCDSSPLAHTMSTHAHRLEQVSLSRSSPTCQTALHFAFDLERLLAAAVRSWWPHKRFAQYARYRDELHKLQRWFGVDAFITVRAVL
jgi:hypothetical protein